MRRVEVWGGWEEHQGGRNSIYIIQRQESMLIIQRVGKTRVMGEEVSRKVFDTRPVTQAESWPQDVFQLGVYPSAKQDRGIILIMC